MKILYPAVFTYDKNDEAYPKGVYNVEFPDLTGCYTFGTTLLEAYENAEDVLNLTLYGLKRSKQELPVSSDLNDIRCTEDQFISLVKADTRLYYKKYRKHLNRR